MASSNEEVLVQTNHVRYHREDGILYLLTERLAWAPASKQNITLSLKYSDMKQQKISPQSKEKVQMQIVMNGSDGASHVFQFISSKGRDLQLQARNQVVDRLQPLIQKFQRKVTSELEVKNRVLASNPTLFQLYKDLVVTSIISPEEFWSTHAKELEKAHKPTVTAPSGKDTEASTDVEFDMSQKSGIQAGFLATLKPQSDEDSGGIRYNLTADTIEAIFRTYPSVKQKHAEYVPHSMSESDFWAHFFQSHYFHRNQLETGKNLFSGDQITMADSQTIASLLENDPFVNVSGFVDSDSTLAAMANDPVDRLDLFGGADKPMAASKQSKQTSSKVTPAQINRLIVQRMNYHSERVLSAQVEGQPGAGSLSKQLQNKNATERITIGDLVRGSEPILASTRDGGDPLEIPDAEVYSFTVKDVSITGDISESNVDKIMSLFHNHMTQYEPKPHLAFEDESSTTIFKEMTAEDDQFGQSGQPVTFALVCGGSFSSSLESEFKGLYATLNELLRHFWVCFPATNAQLEKKLTRMRETLTSFESNKLKAFEQRLSASGVQSPHVVTAHLRSMLDAAERKYMQWKSRKSTPKPR